MYSNPYAGSYGHFNENVAGHYDSGPSTSHMDYEQSFSHMQPNMNVFNPNMMDEPPVTLGVRGGRSTRSSRGRGNEK